MYIRCSWSKIYSAALLLELEAVATTIDPLNTCSYNLTIYLTKLLIYSFLGSASRQTYSAALLLELEPVAATIDPLNTRSVNLNKYKNQNSCISVVVGARCIQRLYC